MSKTYLVGLDGSDHSLNAAVYAAEQAVHTGASVLLVHIIEWSAFLAMGPEELEQRHLDRDQEIEQAHTQAIAPAVRALEPYDVEIETLVHHGHATKLLMSIAAERKVDHIFVGRHGASMLERLMVGSTLNALIQASPLPITVVP